MASEPRPLRLAHTSDVHLGAHASGPRGRGEPRNRRLEAGFRAVVDLARERAADVLLIAGDFFDHARIGGELAAFAAAQCNRFPGATVLLPGNHDPIGAHGPYERHDIERMAPRLHLIREPLAVAADVRESADCERLIAAAVERFGKLDVLVNNAGIGDAPGRGKAVWELTDGEWLDGIAVNLHGTFWCTRAALAHMRPRGEGAILNVASGMGMRATPQSPAYAAAKAGVISLTQSVAAAVARDGVRVNCITPGLVAQSPPATAEEAAAIRQRGRFITARRLGEAWELGPLALFLCSDASAYVTGANYCIDGGGLAGGVAPTGWDPADG